MRAKEIRSMGEKKLEAHNLDLKKELIKLRAQIASGTPPENPGRIRAIRRELARIKTIKTEGFQAFAEVRRS
jgi:large subunit ribosomal protein L29